MRRIGRKVSVGDNGAPFGIGLANGSLWSLENTNWRKKARKEAKDRQFDVNEEFMGSGTWSNKVWNQLKCFG